MKNYAVFEPMYNLCFWFDTFEESFYKAEALAVQGIHSRVCQRDKKNPLRMETTLVFNAQHPHAPKIVRNRGLYKDYTLNDYVCLAKGWKEAR